MLEAERPDRELHGWKDIAGYLGVSIRTAQTLEKDQALPVFRGVGSKPQVFARGFRSGLLDRPASVRFRGGNRRFVQPGQYGTLEALRRYSASAA
jgi:hypothetical protein